MTRAAATLGYPAELLKQPAEVRSDVAARFEMMAARLPPEEHELLEKMRKSKITFVQYTWFVTVVYDLIGDDQVTAPAVISVLAGALRRACQVRTKRRIAINVKYESPLPSPSPPPTSESHGDDASQPTNADKASSQEADKENSESQSCNNSRSTPDVAHARALHDKIPDKPAPHGTALQPHGSDKGDAEMADSAAAIIDTASSPGQDEETTAPNKQALTIPTTRSRDSTPLSSPPPTPTLDNLNPGPDGRALAQDATSRPSSSRGGMPRNPTPPHPVVLIPRPPSDLLPTPSGKERPSNPEAATAIQAAKGNSDKSNAPAKPHKGKAKAAVPTPGKLHPTVRKTVSQPTFVGHARAWKSVAEQAPRTFGQSEAPPEAPAPTAQSIASQPSHVTVQNPSWNEKSVKLFTSMFLFFTQDTFGEEGLQRVHDAIRQPQPSLQSQSLTHSDNPSTPVVPGNSSKALDNDPLERCSSNYKAILQDRGQIAVNTAKHFQSLANFHRSVSFARRQLAQPERNNTTVATLKASALQYPSSNRTNTKMSTRLWDHLVRSNFPADQIDTPAKFTSARHALRDDQQAGERCALLEHHFSSGIFRFLGPGAYSKLRHFQMNHLTSFVNLVLTNFPYVADACRLVERAATGQLTAEDKNESTQEGQLLWIVRKIVHGAYHEVLSALKPLGDVEESDSETELFMSVDSPERQHSPTGSPPSPKRLTLPGHEDEPTPPVEPTPSDEPSSQPPPSAPDEPSSQPPPSAQRPVTHTPRQRRGVKRKASQITPNDYTPRRSPRKRG